MLEALSGKLAAGIKNIVPEHPASYAVLKFAIAVVLNVVFIISLTVAVSFLTDKTGEAVQILISFALLRQVSGGVHLKSGTACILFTTALFTVLSFVNVSPLFVLLMNMISLGLVLWLAPIGIERQTRIPRRHWPKLKVIAALMVVSNIFIGSPVIAASLLAQSVSLLIARKEVKS
ncbi:accessory gene regulator B family protein [Paenibacillus sp. MMS20-IR301]|uniref:accessory gene regulator ArgB-like protein n=1 Tax=Paenibacillus sp. MMS20-IR301 TaxID=2895946 RepID=UPI0028E54EEE|nr:accessory gene regulator B family protein [Paenibacillus sp. MMS20-IR301]WNS45823.1 accessory gene regulator B family protein [Paenibacillus sp. MMS20-IR301]